MILSLMIITRMVEDFATSANIQINALLKPLISKLREIVKLAKVKEALKSH